MEAVFPRVKDVLFALAAAGECEQSLGRLSLQKMVYLADILAPNIKTLVYAEPTYDAARIGENPGRINTGSPTKNLSRQFLRDFRESLRGFDGENVSQRQKVGCISPDSNDVIWSDRYG